MLDDGCVSSCINFPVAETTPSLFVLTGSVLEELEPDLLAAAPPMPPGAPPATHSLNLLLRRGACGGFIVVATWRKTFGMRRCASQARVLCTSGALNARAFHLPNVSLGDTGVTRFPAVAGFKGFGGRSVVSIAGLCSGATPRRTARTTRTTESTNATKTTGAHSRLTLFRMCHWETLRATRTLHPIVTVAVVIRGRRRRRWRILLRRGRAGGRIGSASRSQQQNAGT